MRKALKRGLLIPACLSLAAWVQAMSGAAAEGLAQKAVSASGVRGGLCVLLGVTDGRTIASLGTGRRFLVHGLAADGVAVERARAHLRAAKLYGRVSVERSTFRRLPYADNSVNLVVVPDTPGLLARGLRLGEVVRALAPGGAASLGKTSAASVKPRLNGVSPRVEVTQSGGWVVLRRKKPAGTDEWTHWRHGPDGNAVSGDEVGVPRSVRWQAGPLYQTGGHYYGGGAPVSAGGRLFTVTTEEAVTDSGHLRRQVLWCRDAHNGLLLWRRTTATRRPEFCGNRRPLVAAGDRVYAVLERGGPLLALDAASGKTVGTYDAAIDPDDWMLYAGALIVRKTPDRGANKLLCLDPSRGAVRWKKDVRVKHFVAADGRLFCLTARGKSSEHIVCLDAAGGGERWRAPVKNAWGQLLCHFNGVLVFGGGSKTAGVHGISARDGKHLWTFRYGLLGHGGRPSKVYCVGGLVWVNRSRPSGWVGLSPRTGREEKFHKEAAPCWSRNLCADNRATKRFILTRTMLFVDVKSGEYLRPWGVKNGCSYGSILPANGLIYTFPHQCQCYPMLRGTVGLSSELPPLPTNGRRSGGLERGPAYGKVAGSGAAAESDWPIYRADAGRSGSTKSSVPGGASKIWKAEFGDEAPSTPATEWARRGGGTITSPTVAGARVFLSRLHRHRVLALDAKTGKRLWGFTAGGRVDTPPTIHGGLCLFGSADGWVYCLNAADGKLVWRFRAAPAEWKICAFGQLESAWPVHGSVLVEGGVAYVAAGRHTHLDGGGFLYALDPASGKTLWAKPAKQAGKEYHGLVDLLVSSGKSVCFASRHYDRSAPTAKLGSGQFDSKTGALLGRKQAATGFLTGNTGLLSEMWLGSLHKAPRLSVWTARGLRAQKVVFDGNRTFGFRAAPRHGHASLVAGGTGSAKALWKTDLPIAGKLPARNVTALALTGEVLWAAGRMRRDSNGHVLRAYSAKDGKQFSEVKLDAPVVNDGMAAAGGRLYVSLVDGSLLCLGRK
jgi:outer membrane protein assembly factor BamB